MSKWIAVVVLLGLCLVSVVYSQTVGGKVASVNGVGAHDHPEFLSRVELWHGIAVVVCGNLVLALGLAWRGGKKDQVLSQLLRISERHESEISSLQRSIRSR